MDADLVEPSLAPITFLAPDAARSLPDFLIISPPKTGSTWLASNLRCHPEIFVPGIKETKYFSSYYKWLDLNWYVGHFKDGGERLKGEASPSYAVLPRRTIEFVRVLLPRVKLIYLMRDPVTRAWSHARHNHQYQEANFQECEGDIDTVPEQAWRDNFSHPWPSASGDYLGQIQRWLSVFPREQIYVDLYERIATDPVGLLSRIFRFLGVNSDVDWSTLRTQERILPGPAKMIPDGLKHDLRHLLEGRTRELSAFLEEEFGLCVENHWTETLGGEPAFALAGQCSFSGETESPERRAVYVSRSQDVGRARNVNGRAALRSEDCASRLNEDSLDALLLEMDCRQPRVIVERFHGYDILLHQGRFLGVSEAQGDRDIEWLNRAASGAISDVLVADSLESAKERITRHVISEFRKERDALHAELRQRITECRTLLSDACSTLNRKDEELERVLAAHQAFLSRVHNSWPFRLRRRLRRMFEKRTPLCKSRPANSLK